MTAYDWCKKTLISFARTAKSLATPLTSCRRREETLGNTETVINKMKETKPAPRKNAAVVHRKLLHS
jgi:hypothetical protein